MLAVLLALSLALCTSALKATLKGDFQPAEKSVSGSIEILSDQNGQYFAKFSNFKTDNGPDLFLYFSPKMSATGIADAMMVTLDASVNAAGQALFEGDAVQALPSSFDPSMAKTALIWCREVGVLFGKADLAPTRRRLLETTHSSDFEPAEVSRRLQSGKKKVTALNAKKTASPEDLFDSENTPLPPTSQPSKKSVIIQQRLAEGSDGDSKGKKDNF